MPDLASVYTLANRPTTPLADPLDVAMRGQAYQENRMKLQDLAQARADDQAIREAFARSQGPGGEIDRGMVLKDLASRAPMAGEKLRQSWAAQDIESQKHIENLRKTLAERSEAELKRAAQITDLIGRTAYASQTPEQWDRNFQELSRIIPTATEQIGKFSPEYRNEQLNKAKTIAQIVDEEAAARQGQKPMSQIGQINEDERRGIITPQQAEAARRRATTQAPAVHVGFSQPFEVVDPQTQKPVLVQQDKAGNIRPVSGYQPKSVDKPFTEAQGNAYGFGMRAQESNEIMRKLEKQGVTSGGLMTRALGAVPVLGNYAVDPEIQRYQQAQRNFISAVLRKESGAAISPAEFENEAKKYFPQPGDSPEVIRQKAEARKTGIQVLEIQAGRPLPKLGKKEAAPKTAAPIPRISGPNDPALQRLKPGDRFIGHDGVERVKR